jgi:hypothetical protein
VIYFFGPANLRVTFGDGKTTDSSVTEGEVVVRDPLTHAVENIGNTELHALLWRSRALAARRLHVVRTAQRIG